jgi:hypothetical protein
MTPKKLVIAHLLQNGGKLQKDMTWFSLGEQCGVEVKDKERAKKDKKYYKKTVGRLTQQYWQRYLKQSNKLELAKQIQDAEGNIMWETYKKPPKKDALPEDTENYEIEAFTTNPYGGVWLKGKRKENILADDHIKELVSMMKEVITPQDKPQPQPISTPRGLFIYGADKHIGALTKKDSIYTNDYDRDEIEKRLVYKTLRNIRMTNSIFGSLESLFIMDLGDALDGFNNKTTGGLRGTSQHTLPQQLNNREQFDTYVRVHKLLFDLIVEEEMANDIYFVATSNSNHGGDFEYTAMRAVEEYLNLRYPFIKTVVNYYPLNHFIYGEHAIIFGHGKDDEDMKHGMPLNLTDKVENYLNDYIRMNSLEAYNVSFVSADLHQSSENYGQALRYKKVLSQYGSTKWMHTNFGSGSPGLSFDIYEKNSKLIWKADDFFEIDNQSNTGISFK